MSQSNISLQVAAVQFVMLTGSLFAVLWLLSFSGTAVVYPTGEPIERTFRPVLNLILAAGVSLTLVLWLVIGPGQSDGHDTA